MVFYILNHIILKSLPFSENKIMHWIQTVLLSLCTTGIVFCLKFLWAINGYIERTQIRDQVQDEAISVFRVDIGLAKKSNEDMEKRIIHLEAILPNNKIKTEP